MQSLSCVIPVYNEEGTIPELHRRLSEAMQKDFPGFLSEIVFIDDGSTDQTVPIILKLREQDSRVKLVQFSRNFGHHIAISAGLDYAAGDFIVMMDGDLQDQPEEIIKLYQKLQEGNDVVYGERIEKKFSLAKRVNSAVFIAVLRRLVNEPITINTTIFRIMTKQVVENIKLLRERNRYVVGVVGWVGFKHAAQPVEHGERYAGVTKYRLKHQMALAMNAAFSYSTYALTLVTRIGFLFVALSIAASFWILYRKLAYGTSVTGWASIAIAVLGIGGFQTIVLGMIGEYVGRNYIENKNRPLYVIREFYG